MPTKIDWSDETINPLGWGCYGPQGTPEAPKPCNYCYARRFAARHTRGCDLCHLFIPHWHPEQFDKPHRWKKHRRIFVQSMGDLMHPYTPPHQISMVQAMIQALSRHTFILLTKNTDRYQEFNPWPENAWLGGTIVNQPDADRILPGLLKADARVRFVSHEPLLSRIDMTPWLQGEADVAEKYGIPAQLSWAILGAQTGPGAVKPDLEWVQSLIDQYRAAGVPIFLKENLHWPGQVQEWPS